ncbi:MAG TPA: PIN domain-containing protein [Devosiaceae bacterium]|nr:PIN domain-containing protein [Devosiaceae bacterium]
MILADTSIWVDHLRGRETPLIGLLATGQVMVHPFVVGEIALGHLPRRAETIDSLKLLPTSIVAQHEEVLEFLDRHALHGAGIGWVDAHLAASTRLTNRLQLWSRDRRLAGVARALDIAADLD